VFNPDGSQVASGSSDGTVVLWEAVVGRELLRLLHGGGVEAVVFNPDGSQVASGSDDGTVVIWEAASGRALHRLEHGGVTSVVFSPDGSRVASGSTDGSVKIWGSATGKLLATFLAVGQSDWMTYTREGYFIGSEDVQKRVMMKWEHGGNQYPTEEIFPRDNPNPQKVAEALAAGRSRKQKPRTPPRKAAGISGKRQPLLPGGSKK
jgi:WD40 repeat protein